MSDKLPPIFTNYQRILANRVAYLVAACMGGLNFLEPELRSFAENDRRKGDEAAEGAGAQDNGDDEPGPKRKRPARKRAEAAGRGKRALEDDGDEGDSAPGKAARGKRKPPAKRGSTPTQKPVEGVPIFPKDLHPAMLQLGRHHPGHRQIPHPGPPDARDDGDDSPEADSDENDTDQKRAVPKLKHSWEGSPAQLIQHLTTQQQVCGCCCVPHLGCGHYTPGPP